MKVIKNKGAAGASADFVVKGMSCASCVARIEKALLDSPGVLRATVNLATARAHVDYLPSETNRRNLARVIESAGYRVAEPEIGPGLEDTERLLREKEYQELRTKVVAGAVLGVVIFLGSMRHWFPWVPAFLQNFFVLWALATPVQFVLGLQFYRGAWGALRHRTADMNTLVAVGTSAAYFMSVAATVFPSLFNKAGVVPEVYFDTSALIILLILFGKMLEARAKGRTSEAIKRLMGLRPKTARVVRSGGEFDIPVEDVGALAWETDPATGETSLTENFWIVNPGFGWSLPVSQGGKFLDGRWPTPKAKREYRGLNVSLEKRFSDNWQGGVNYTLSRVSGNYSGLASTDEVGYDYAGQARLGTNVQLYYDDWFLMYDGLGKNLDGPLPQDRTHVFKAYGTYAFPFGLTVGVVGYGRSGLPVTTKLHMNNRWMLVENRGDMGRLPFTFWASVYLDYTLKLGNKYRASINLQIDNVTNTKTIQSKIYDYNLDGIWADEAQILDGTLASTYKQMVIDAGDTNSAYGKWETRFAPWSARLGFKFSF